MFEDGNGWKRSPTAATTSAASPPISPPINRRKEGQSWKKATKNTQKEPKKYQKNTHTSKAPPVRPRHQLARQLIGTELGKNTKKYRKNTHTNKVPQTPTKRTKNHRQLIGGRSDRAGKKHRHGLLELKKGSVLAVIFSQIKAEKKEYAKLLGPKKCVNLTFAKVK